MSVFTPGGGEVTGNLGASPGDNRSVAHYSLCVSRLLPASVYFCVFFRCCCGCCVIFQTAGFSSLMRGRWLFKKSKLKERRLIAVVVVEEEEGGSGES